jgi:hypothetical protein
MKKNKIENDELRILTELIRDLSRLDEQEKKIRKAERTKAQAIQNVLDRLCMKLEERAENDEEISSLLQTLQKTTSSLKSLLKQ